MLKLIRRSLGEGGLSIAVTICLLFSSFAKPASGEVSPLGGAELASQIDQIIRQDSQKTVEFSIHIMEAGSGRSIYSHDASRPMVPASNMKVITGATALRYLGAEYEFKTQVGLCPASASLDASRGGRGESLVIIGSGDPLLGDKATDARYGRKPDSASSPQAGSTHSTSSGQASSPQAGWIFEDISAALKAGGTTSIKDIIVDSSIFDDERVHPNWPKEELNRWYACEVCGVNYNDNCIELTVQSKGGVTTVLAEPETAFVTIVNEVQATSGDKSAVGAHRNQVPNTIIVKGKCKGQEGPISVAIERPAAFFGFLLAENLKRAGITVQGQLVERIAPQDCKMEILKEYKTSMADCLSRCNKNSLGLAAEALVKTMGAKASGGLPPRLAPLLPSEEGKGAEAGKNGSWQAGREIMRRYLLELDIEESEFFIDDGSGLSKENRLSARAVTAVLHDVYKSGNWQMYKDSLAVGGVDGTMARYFKDQKYKGKVFGKTGYIGHVRSLSGVCCTDEGDYIFSILANNANGRTRPAINKIAEAIIDSYAAR
jgi:D-alanyl-D-alanine carboxypeptidase/D-alanyl-D-alanine-endopeptidase (penicillin-binding protein 4)